MRNYIQQFYAKIEWDVDINPPNPPTPEYQFLMDATDVMLQASIDSFVADLQAQSYNENIRVTERAPVYWLLDKANLSLILQYAVFGSLASSPRPAWIYQGSKTPRSGWKDADNVSRNPPPSEKAAATRAKADFRGAAGLLEALQGLLQLAADLTRLRRFRQAGIVLYAYNQVIKQTWSITQAIQYLIDNRITATV